MILDGNFTDPGAPEVLNRRLAGRDFLSTADAISFEKMRLEIVRLTGKQPKDWPDAAGAGAWDRGFAIYEAAKQTHRAEVHKRIAAAATAAGWSAEESRWNDLCEAQGRLTAWLKRRSEWAASVLEYVRLDDLRDLSERGHLFPGWRDHAGKVNHALALLNECENDREAIHRIRQFNLARRQADREQAMLARMASLEAQVERAVSQAQARDAVEDVIELPLRLGTN